VIRTGVERGDLSVASRAILPVVCHTVCTVVRQAASGASGRQGTAPPSAITPRTPAPEGLRHTRETGAVHGGDTSRMCPQSHRALRRYSPRFSVVRQVKGRGIERSSADRGRSQMADTRRQNTEVERRGSEGQRDRCRAGTIRRSETRYQKSEVVDGGRWLALRDVTLFPLLLYLDDGQERGGAGSVRDGIHP
jgi:hypothetical protein